MSAQVRFEISHTSDQKNPVVIFHFVDYTVYSAFWRLLHDVFDARISTGGTEDGWKIMLTLPTWASLNDFVAAAVALDLTPYSPPKEVEA